MPQPDPLPLSAPVTLFHVLLVGTFTLHILAMNVLLGGSVITAASALLDRFRPHAQRALLLQRAGRPLTVAAAMTVWRPSSSFNFSTAHSSSRRPF
jgi:hypothetical protein